MDDEARNFQIMEIAELLAKDNISIREQDQKKLQKYYDFAQKEFNLTGDDSVQLVNETFLYLTLKNAKDVDPLQDGDKFGAGFS
ncbi:MAG: hypothetical protein FJ357_05020 [Thaumarchaeota archaeon]|nr:hypothetical protein [Nitrososphaerota archaeon]